QISAGADDDIEIDVIFAPKFDLMTMGAGPKTTTLTVRGPAQNATWTMNVPVAGTFNGKRFGIVFVANAAEVPVLSGEAQVLVPFTLYGNGTPSTGTIRAKNLPNGVSLAPMTVSVGGNQAQSVQVPLKLAWNGGGLLADGAMRQVDLSFDYGGGSSA